MMINEYYSVPLYSPQILHCPETEPGSPVRRWQLTPRVLHTFVPCCELFLLIAAQQNILPRMWWMHMHKFLLWMMSCNYPSWKHLFQDCRTHRVHFHSHTHSLLKVSDIFSVCVVEQPVAWTNSSSVVCCVASCLLHTTKHTHLAAGIFSWPVICMGIFILLHLF